MAMFEGFTEKYTAELDEMVARHQAEMTKGLDRIFDSAKIRLDVLDGKPVSLFRRVVAEAVIPPTSPPTVLYKPWPKPQQRPVERLGRPLSNSYTYTTREEAETIARNRAAEVKGAFFEIRRPSWDFKMTGKDLIYVYGIEGAEFPNPTLHFVSVDPGSKMYGRPTDMTAGDIGFIPCCYGNHSWAYPRPELGKIDLPDYSMDIHDLAAMATGSETSDGLELLARAVEYGAVHCQKSEPFEDVTRAYGMQVLVMSGVQT